VFVFEIKPKEGTPQSVISFDINENTVAISRIDIKTTVDKIADWNRQYMVPELYTIKTDFGRLARRYERVRNAIIERLKPHFALPSGKYVNVTSTREYRKFVRKLREEDRKVGRVRQIANELTKTPAIIVTEELGERPQDEMINGVNKSELRHRIKQIPFKKLENTVEDKALERGSKLFRVSSYRNSRVCPIHFVRLERTDDWHTLQCPLGHLVDRDYASVMNMDWKLTPESWTKGVWWNMKREMNWREYEDESNPLVPYFMAKILHTTLKEFKASEESPAMLARGCPMNPTGYKMKVTARKPPKKGGGQSFSKYRDFAKR
jgi:IS605 OrfB family transposase